MQEQQQPHEGNVMALEPSPPRPSGETALIASETARAIQEVQASLIIAKRFPRNEMEAVNKIVAACKRPQVAASAMYAFPRKSQGKNTTISGPTVKLLRVVAQNWGNVEFGTRELANDEEQATVEAFCWDKESNVKEVRSVVIRHERKVGEKLVKIFDVRDRYENAMSQAQRRVRATIEAVIPAYVVQEAVEECKRTLARGDGKAPLPDRVRKLAGAFKENLGVSHEMIEKRMGHKLDLCTADEFVELHQIYEALKDGEQKRQDFFDFKAPGGAGAEELNTKFAEKKETK